jgi:hypothetical protein
MTDIQKEKARSLIMEKLEKSFEVNKDAPTGVPIHKAICFLLDKYNRGNYYGTINIKIVGTSVQSPRENDVTHKLDLNYEV